MSPTHPRTPVLFCGSLRCWRICVWAAGEDKGFQTFLLLSPECWRDALSPRPRSPRGGPGGEGVGRAGGTCCASVLMFGLRGSGPSALMRTRLAAVRAGTAPLQGPCPYWGCGDGGQGLVCVPVWGWRSAHSPLYSAGRGLCPEVEGLGWGCRSVRASWSPNPVSWGTGVTEASACPGVAPRPGPCLGACSKGALGPTHDPGPELRGPRALQVVLVSISVGPAGPGRRPGLRVPGTRNPRLWLRRGAVALQVILLNGPAPERFPEVGGPLWLAIGGWEGPGSQRWAAQAWVEVGAEPKAAGGPSPEPLCWELGQEAGGHLHLQNGAPAPPTPQGSSSASEGGFSGLRLCRHSAPLGFHGRQPLLVWVRVDAVGSLLPGLPSVFCRWFWV